MADQAQHGGTILDQYVRSAPDPQNAIDIFAGEWASQFPAGFETLRAGTSRLFEDGRLQWGLPLLGGVAGKRVLELGPLEGGHSYMLQREGAAEVIAVEANTRAYLKCLITREILRLSRVSFLCGDFLEYLRQRPAKFDACLALGVLYHMLDPVELIELIARSSDRVLMWTHYYDPEIMAHDPRFAQRFRTSTRAQRGGFAHTLYPDSYGADLAKPGFCGGSNPQRNWMSRDEIVACLAHFGLGRIEIQDDPGHPNAPAVTLVARRC
jgi:SAM-dependent methyltransferase